MTGKERLVRSATFPVGVAPTAKDSPDCHTHGKRIPACAVAGGHAVLRTLRCMEAMVSGVLLVGAFAAVAAGAVAAGVLLYRISRSSRAVEPPDG
jgi:hypothetical protein